MKKGILALAVVGLVSSVPAVASENPFAKDQATLQLADLDLATAEGQQRLAIRMDNAARTVCGDRLATVHLEANTKASECRAVVLADIRAQIETRLAAKASATQLAYNR